MDPRDLAEIKARADEVRDLLQYGTSVQELLDNDVPNLLAEVDQLTWQLSQAGMCPHGGLYKERSCVPCFGDGTEELLECKECSAQTWHRGGKCLRHDATAPKAYELMQRELEELRSRVQASKNEEPAQAGKCPHGEPYEARSCVACFGDGTEELWECKECSAQTWHRGGKCLRHEETAPKPYELMQRETKELRGKVLAIEQECAGRVRASQEQMKEIQISRELMRDALEYIKPRIGSSNLGESLAKIQRALAPSSVEERSMDKQQSGEAPE